MLFQEVFEQMLSITSDLIVLFCVKIIIAYQFGCSADQIVSAEEHNEAHIS